MNYNVIEEYDDYKLIQFDSGLEMDGISIYTCQVLNPNGVLIKEWDTLVNLSSIKDLSKYKENFSIKKFKSTVDEDKENPAKKMPISTDVEDKSNTKPSFVQKNYYKSYETKPKKDYVKEYCKSDTLVFHLDDYSTRMLSQLYEGKNWDVITDGYLPQDQINKLIENHDKIVCLGHGTSVGLIGGNITANQAKALKGKRLFIIWCNADAFFDKIGVGEGSFITGNMPSEVWECAAAGCGKISSQLMLDNITYWSKLCADKIDQCLNGNVKEAVDYIRTKYIEAYGDHPVTIYNAERTKVHGTSMKQNIDEVRQLADSLGFNTPNHA